MTSIDYPYRYLFVFIICFLLLLGLKSSLPEFQADLLKLKSEYQSVIVAISDTHAIDQDVEGWSFINDQLDDSISIFLLGEQTHYDGSTFTLKSKLVKYLHEERDVDVLVFEAGLYDCWRMWEMIEAEVCSQQTFRMGIFGLWTEVEEMQSLFTYICETAKTNDPLYVQGFDIQPSASYDIYSDSMRHADLRNYLDSLPVFKVSDYPYFTEIADSLMFFASKYLAQKFLTPHIRDQVLIDLDNLSQFLFQIPSPERIDLIHHRYIQGLRYFFEYRWNYEWGSSRRFQLRDSLMAENIIWLKNEMYPKDRIMVWTSNLHLRYNDSLLTFPTGWKPMGSIVKEHFHNSSYHLAFTSHEGKRFNTSSLDCIERRMCQFGYDLAFLNFRLIPSNHPLSSQIVTKCLEHQNHKGKWSQMVDGVFFINHMKRSTYLEK